MRTLRPPEVTWRARWQGWLLAEPAEGPGFLLPVQYPLSTASHGKRLQKAAFCELHRSSQWAACFIWTHIFNWAVNILCPSSKIPKLIATFFSFLLIEVWTLLYRCHKKLRFLVTLLYRTLKSNKTIKMKNLLKWKKMAVFVSMWNIN